MTLSELIATMPGYTGATTDQAVLDFLTTPSVDVQLPIDKPTLFKWVAQNGRIKKLKDGAADTNLSYAVRNYCETGLMMFTTSAVPSFDTGDASNIGLIDALVAAGVFDETTDNDKSSLLALGYKQLSPSETIGINPNNLSIQIVQNARAA